MNIVGIFKIVILLLISFAGFGALAGKTKIDPPNNFDNAFAGTRNDIFGISSCIYNVSDHRTLIYMEADKILRYPFKGNLELCGV
jgi:hypothetical protein